MSSALTPWACLFASLLILTRLHIGITSVPVVFCLVYSAMAYGGYYFHAPEQELIEQIGIFSDRERFQTFAEVNYCVLLVSIGAAVGILSDTRRSTDLMTPHASKAVHLDLNVIITFAALMLAMLISGSGLMNLFLRHEYMVEESRLLKSVGGLGCISACFLLGCTSVANRWQRHLATVMVLVIAVVFLGYSSRSFGICVVLYILALHTRFPSKLSLAFLVLTLALFPLLLSIPLQMRSNATQGIIPLLYGFFGFFGSDSPSYYSLLDNFLLSSFDILVATAHASQIDYGYLITAVNPLPGSMTDFYSYNSGLSDYIPYSSLGEWLSVSLFLSLLFCFILGFVFGRVECFVVRTNSVIGLMARLPLMLYVLLSLQYTTRASLRPLIYLIAFSIVYRAYRHLAARR